MLALALLLGSSGCGDLSRDELNRGVESLSALAAQGELIANGVARDATRSTYTRVMAKALGGEAEHEAEKLAHAEPSPEVRHERNAAVHEHHGALVIALGVIAALGGFLDIGDLVFNTQAGALFRYDLLWAVLLGTLGFGMGLVALIASTVVNLLTVAAELGGLAIVLTLLFDASFSLFVVLSMFGLIVAVALAGARLRGTRTLGARWQRGAR